MQDLESTPAAPALVAEEVVTLLDWKRTIFELYGEVRSGSDPRRGWERWGRVRDQLFATHPQSPLPSSSRESFPGCHYFDYDPAARVVADVVPVEPEQRQIVTSTGASYAFSYFGGGVFTLYDVRCSVELYWLEGYGGGLFLPFGDGTSGESTYPAGRYLLDTVKGADLGSDQGRQILDFNFAYNPSCAYNPIWTCPLAPTRNWLPVHVRAGEQTP